MDYKINFDEPIPDLIERLKREHRQIESKLAELEAMGILYPQSLKILQKMGDPIVHHAVEEEAVIMRIIMHNAKEQSAESIKIAREHNWILDFIKHRIPRMESMPQQEVQQEIVKFIQNLRRHFKEEEQVMFPLALKADSLQRQ